MASQDWFDKDFYKVLGVSKDVSAADLKKTYRKLARQFHPDSNPGDAKAEARFKEISEAYTVLSDADQRKEYNQIRAMGGGARFTAGGQPGGLTTCSATSSARAGAPATVPSRARLPASRTSAAGCSAAPAAASASPAAGTAASAARRRAPT